MLNCPKYTMHKMGLGSEKTPTWQGAGTGGFSTYWLGPTRSKIRTATAGEWPAQEYMGYSKFERLHLYQQ